MSEERSQVRSEPRKLAAIMFTDIVGFSRQMGVDESRMLRLLEVHNHLIHQAVSTHHGHVIKTIGDAFLVDFSSVVHAVQCAQQIQQQLRTHNAEKEKTEQIHVRIGIHLGDIVQKDDDVFGDGVNIASRLQSLAEPDTICISDIVYRDVTKKLDLGTVVSLGKPKLKNIAERFPVYALLSETPTGVRQKLHVQRLKLSRRITPTQRMVAGGVLLSGILVLAWSVVLPKLLPPYSSLLTQEAQPPLPLPDKPSIVVLPFDNMSKDPEQDYFSNGITEVLTSDLSRIASLFVIARNTAFTYKGKAVNVQEVGKELGVRYVLEGSVQKASDQVRIVAQLIDTTTGSHLWSERYDRSLKDIFALQDDVVQKIVTTLKLQITLLEKGWIVQKTTNSFEAYDYFLRGTESFSHTTKESTLQARQMFEKAMMLDSQYADAYAGVAATYYLEWVWRWSQNPQTLEKALGMAQRAISLNESLPRAHAILGMIYAQQKRYEQAIAEGERAIALDPNSAISYGQQAEALNVMGRPQEALLALEIAIRLNPRATGGYLINLSSAYYMMGRYTEAVSTLKSLLARNPNWLSAYIVLSACYLRQWASQQEADAQTLMQVSTAAQRVLTLNNASPFGHLLLGMSYLFQKQYEQAIAEMQQAIALDPHNATYPAVLAETLSRVGRVEEAMGMVEQALGRQPSTADEHLNFVGSAYYFAGKPEEAIPPLKQYLTRYPNILPPHLTLAAVYSELGKDAEARAEVTEVLRLNPKFSLEVHKERVPIKDPAMLERHIAALRKAGLK